MLPTLEESAGKDNVSITPAVMALRTFILSRKIQGYTFF
jgi:hypothetical protein